MMPRFFSSPHFIFAFGLLVLAFPAHRAEGQIPSITPDPLAISVRSGESASKPLILSNATASPLDWQLVGLDANSRAATLEGQLDGIIHSGTTLNGPLPLRYDFTGGEAGTTSLSGNQPGQTSLLNNGNRLLTNLGGPLVYTDDRVANSPALGPNGRYFTRKMPGLFVFGAETNGISWFEVAGTLSYGSSKQSSAFQIAHSGTQWSAFVVNHVDFWRTINHLVLVDQSGLQQTTGAISSQQQRITGLSGKRRIYHFLYVTTSTAVQPQAVFENLATRFLDLLPWTGSRLSFDPAAGSSPPLAQGNSSVTFNAFALPPGSYSGTVQARTPGGDPLASAPVNIEVTEPRLELPAAVSKVMLPGMVAETVRVPILSNLTDEQAWTATMEAPVSWLSVESPQGNTPDDLALRFDPTGLAPGNYSASVRIECGSADFRLPVSLRVAALSIRKFLADPRRPRVYAVNQDGKQSGQLIEIDIVSRRILRASDVGQEPSDLDLTENGRQVIVINTTNPSLTRVNLQDFSVDETIPLSEFSNRNDDVGGHVKCGKGDIVYYVDEQWGPRLRVFNTATRTVLQTLSAESGNSPDLSNNNGYGDIGLSPDRSRLFGWRQYGDGAGSAGTHVVRFSVNPDGTLGGFARSANYSLPNFTREPFDTPVMFSHDGSRLIIKDREIDQENLDYHRVVYPNGIYAIPPNAGITVGRSAIYSSRGDETLLSLPVASSIQAVSADYSSLVYFNSTTKSLGWVNLQSTPGYARMGLTATPADGTNVAMPESLHWLPQTGITGYQVFLGSDRERVESATTGAAEYLGMTNNVWFALSGGLTPGLTYYWRVVPIGADGHVAGPGEIRSFRPGGLVLSRQSIETTAVRGLVSHPESLTLDADTPIDWTAVANVPWISGISSSGTTPATLLIVIDTTGLATGFHQGSLTINSADGPITVPVELRVTEPNVVKLLRHPERAVVYGLHQAATGEGYSQVLEIDAADARILRASPLGLTAPTDAALDAENGRLYVANAGSAPTSVLDVDAWQPLAPLDLGDVFRAQVASGGRLVTLGSGTSSNVILWNATTGEKLATLSTFYNGDIKTDPSGNFLYLAGNGTSGSNLRKYRIASNTFELLITGPQIGFGSRNLVLSPDASRVFWLGRVLDADLTILAQMPSSAEIHATNQSGDLAVTDGKVFWSDSATEVASLPFTSTIAAISADDAQLVRYNTATRTLHATPLASITDLPGPKPRPGQVLDASPAHFSWSPVDGAVSYRFHIAESITALGGMTVPTAVTSSPFFEPATPLDFGRFHFWRADAVMADNTVIAGKVQSFGINYPAGPPLASSGQSESGVAASISDRHLLVGLSGAARLFDFDPASGVTSATQRLALPGSASGFGAAVAMNAGKAAAGAATFANPATSGGAAFVYRSGEAGYWESSGPIAPPSPVNNEQFGFGLAASGNLMLVGSGNASSGTGRVCAYITEPGVARTQTFSASDGVTADGFGRVIAMQGNLALIAAPGRGSSFNRLPCLYAFDRSTTNGQWQQSQKIDIPGATSMSNAIRAIAISGNLMATNVGNTGVAVFTRDRSGRWSHLTTIQRSSIPNSTTSFGNALALVGEQLFIGDPSATHLGTSGGVVFSFSRSGNNWIAGPVIVPQGTRSNFGNALSARDRWLLVAGGSSGPGWLFQVSATENRTPRFTPGIPTQAVAGRAFGIPIRAEDADGDNMVIDKLQGPSWLGVDGHLNGQATLFGLPTGPSGAVHQVQLRVRDSGGGEALHTYELTLLAPTDMPVLDSSPLAADLGVGQELILRASASGIGPFQWQWFKDGKAIEGANASTYLISEVGRENAGRYHVRVSNVVGPVESAAVEVLVRAADRYAGDWPTFGGSPAHNGRHPAALEETHFLPAWNTGVQPGFVLNRAAISDGRAVVVPQSRFATGILVKGLDLETGATLWSFPLPSSNSTNPPSIYQDKVYFQRGKGTGGSDVPQLFSLNAATGQQLWASTFGAQWESYEAPAVGEAGIFINGGAYGGMYGFNFNGSERFYHGLPQYDRWTPTLANGRLFSWVGGGTGAAFTEHSPTDGSVLWSIQPGSGQNAYSMNTVSAVAGNTAAISSTTELICVDLSTRAIRWRVPGAHLGSPGIADGRVFAIQGNAVRSYSLADGSPNVTYQTDASSSTLTQQPILFNDRLVIASETKTWIFNLQDGALLQTLNAGGRLSYSNGYLLAAGNDGVLRAFIALNYNPKLASLQLDSGAFLPEFDKLKTRYIATVPFDTEAVTITPTTEYPDASLAINGVPSPNGSASAPVALQVGENEIPIFVTAEDGITTMTYTLAVTRLPRNFVFNSGKDVPLEANGFMTGGFPVDVILNYHPVPGSTLTMVSNTGPGFIHGRFGNLTQGQRITLQHDGVDYVFVANYHGGTGNDLVLHWADTSAVAWGQNNQGQLGNGTTVNAASPVPVELPEGVLAGKTLFGLSAGYLHSLALLHDGSVAAWGYNNQGQLGLGHQSASPLAGRVDNTGALVGKIVIAIAAGAFHNLALCDDGTIISWGMNNHGQLGTGDRQMRLAPVLVGPLGALAGKRVVAITAGFYHSLALCDDGTVIGWGYNDEGELGDGSTATALVPVAVDAGGALAGKFVTRISAGQYHALALCKDGTLVAWGYNARGQLGDGTTTDRHAPVAVKLAGVLAEKTVTAPAAGGLHSLLRFSDGTLAGWGDNSRGQLIPAAAARFETPQPVIGSALEIHAGAYHSVARRTLQSIQAWGDPRAAWSTSEPEGDLASPPWIAVASGPIAFHNLAIVAGPGRVGVPALGLADWREMHFGTSASEGEAADCHDCNHDGVPNLVKYAFGLDPHQNSAGKIPQPQRVGDRLELRLSRLAIPNGVTCGAEWSPDLSPGSWRDIPDSGSGVEHLFSLPVDTAPNRFMRLKVTQNSSPH